MPNTFAYAALLLWPLVAVLLFNYMHPVRALIWTVLGAYLLLPVDTEFDFAGLPSFDKSTIPNIVALFCCILFVREKWRLIPRDGLIVALALTFIFSPFVTALNNGAPVIREVVSLPAMSQYDALSQATTNAITLIPFLLGSALIATATYRRWLLEALLIAGLVYSIPMLAEIRLSPQLHNFAYGFHPHSFGQQMRMGGFRPMVFLGHGLLIGIFCAMTLIAAIALWRQRIKVWQLPPVLPVVYLAVVLVLCKSVGALILGALIGFAVAIMRPKRLALLSAVLTLIVVIYPLPRAAGWIPVETMAEVTRSFSEEREESFVTRLTNENFLLERAEQKRFFGWGSWGRNRTAAEETGIATITDGTWIIVIGCWGWVGYIALFGLLGVPSLKLLRYHRRLNALTMNDAALFAMLAVNLLDLIPNSSLRPLTWLIAGALCALRMTAKAGNAGANHKEVVERKETVIGEPAA